MKASQIVLTGAISVAVATAVCVPLMSMADEARSKAVLDAVNTAAACVLDVDNDGFAESLDNDGNGRPDLFELARANKDGKRIYLVKDENASKSGLRDTRSSDGVQGSRVKEPARLVLSLSDKRNVASADQDVTDEMKKAPMPGDAIVGVKKMKRQHVDMATERLIASVGEQARYIGIKEGVPASILIAETIRENNRWGSELSTSDSYGVYGAYLEEVAETYADGLAETIGETSDYDAALEAMKGIDQITWDDWGAIEELIETYELDRYDKPIPNSVEGQVVDSVSGESLGLGYVDYANLERIATSYIGTPYVWGGSTAATGFDCSGLVQWSYSEALGIMLPRTTYVQQYAGVSVPLDVDKLRMGDLLFFHDDSEGTYHIAMYLSDGYYIHAPHTGDVVRIASMDEFAPTFARRIVEFAPSND